MIEIIVSISFLVLLIIGSIIIIVKARHIKIKTTNIIKNNNSNKYDIDLTRITRISLPEITQKQSNPINEVVHYNLNSQSNVKARYNNLYNSSLSYSNDQSYLNPQTRQMIKEIIDGTLAENDEEIRRDYDYY